MTTMRRDFEGIDGRPAKRVWLSQRSSRSDPILKGKTESTLELHRSLVRRAQMLALPLALTIALSSQPVSGQSASSLTVFAAASLTDSFTEIGKAFDAKTGGKTTLQFAGSQVLRTQLENGAKADVYASASVGQFDPLVKSGSVVSAGIFTKNRLVVIVPKKGVGNVKTLADLAKAGIKLVIADKTVPVGAHTRQVLKNLEQVKAYGANYAANVLKNVISEETNVRQVALKVQLGEADTGVVYITDVTPGLAPTIIQIAIPTRFNVVASNPIGTLKAASNPDAARAFVDFVRGSAGQAILSKWGFLPTR